MFILAKANASKHLGALSDVDFNRSQILISKKVHDTFSMVSDECIRDKGLNIPEFDFWSNSPTTSKSPIAIIMLKARLMKEKSATPSNFKMQVPLGDCYFELPNGSRW